MERIYNDLNLWLNDICNYLEKENSFLLENIYAICRLNDTFLKNMDKYSFQTTSISNHLTYEDVYMLAREIVSHIDRSYLHDFDHLISSGELDFSFDSSYLDSCCESIHKGKDVKKLINVNRKFNYDDVHTLVHEFIHYTSGEKNSVSKWWFGEFLSIYFETYAIDYLFEKGINPEEIDSFYRIKNTIKQADFFSDYEIILLAFIQFGNLSDDTVSLLQRYLLNIKKETFEKECRLFHENLCIVKKRHIEKIEENPQKLGFIFSKEFIIHNYRYILGTFLAFYARKNVDFSKIVSLNNHIHEYAYMDIFDICFSMGIDISDDSFPQRMFCSIDDYINEKQKYYIKERK